MVGHDVADHVVGIGSTALHVLGSAGTAEKGPETGERSPWGNQIHCWKKVDQNRLGFQPLVVVGQYAMTKESVG